MGVLLFVLAMISLIGLVVCLACWVYTDAKQSGEQAGLWALITVIVPSFFGVLIYFLVGRKSGKRMEKNKFVKPLIALFILFIISTAGFVTKVVTSTDLPVIKGASLGMISNTLGDKWNVSFKSSGETLTESIKLTKEQMDKITITSSSNKGKVYLLITQDENSEFMDITNMDNQKIDLSNFQEGRFNFYILNEEAKDVKIKINWEF